jgi:ribonuclease PH
MQLQESGTGSRQRKLHMQPSNQFGAKRQETALKGRRMELERMVQQMVIFLCMVVET